MVHAVQHGDGGKVAMREIDEQQRRLDWLNGEGLQVASDATPLDFLSAVYRDVRQPMERRMRAARDAAQYVHPTYKAMAIVPMGGDFATRLEKAIERSQSGGRLLTQAPTIEHDREELRPEPTSATERRQFIPRRRI
jgi:hypothetical protein